MSIPSNLDPYAGRLALLGAVAIAAISALGGHHLGVTHGIGEAVELRDDNRVLASVCGLTLQTTERAVAITRAVEATWDTIHGERMEAMIESETLTEVDR